MSLIFLTNRLPSLFSNIKETPPARPNISARFIDSTSNPKNIALNTLNKSPCETMMIFSSSLPITSSKKGFNLFHSSLRLSASENSLSSIVLSCCSKFSRSHLTDFPQHRPRFLSRNSVLNIGMIFRYLPTFSAVCLARFKSEEYITYSLSANSAFIFCQFFLPAEHLVQINPNLSKNQPFR